MLIVKHCRSSIDLNQAAVRIFGCLLFILLAFGTTDLKGASIFAQTYTISGVVTKTGSPLNAATVQMSGIMTATTTTDNAGHYAFSGLPSGGPYFLSVSSGGSGVTGFVLNLTSDRVVNLTIRETHTTSVVIHVKDENGHGVGGVSVLLDLAGGAISPFLQTNSSGDLSFGFSSTTTGGGLPIPYTLSLQKPFLSFSPPSVTLDSEISTPQEFNFIARPSTTPTAYIQFSAPSYVVGEGEGSATITVERIGDLSTAVGVTYYISPDETATEKRDFTMAAGVLSFAPGETSKTFTVLITDNAYVQGPHTLRLALTYPTGGAVLNTPLFTPLVILDNDTVPPTANPIDEARFFVKQHYYDFLNRVPDSSGLDYWTDQIAQCGSDLNCIKSRRRGVSAAFFVEQEFQQTGSVVYRLNKAAFGWIETYSQFMADRNRLIGGPQLQDSIQGFVAEFTAAGLFKFVYPDTMTSKEFVNKLFDTAGLTPYQSERDAAIQALSSGSKSRAQILLDVIEIPEFKAREYNPSFVLMQYYGYLRRDPDSDGFQFWLNILNNKLPNDASGYNAMVCAFITSAEYQDRFSPIRTHNDTECGP